MLVSGVSCCDVLISFTWLCFPLFVFSAHLCSVSHHSVVKSFPLALSVVFTTYLVCFFSCCISLSACFVCFFFCFLIHLTFDFSALAHFIKAGLLFLTCLPPCVHLGSSPFCKTFQEGHHHRQQITNPIRTHPLKLVFKSYPVDRPWTP